MLAENVETKKGDLQTKLQDIKKQDGIIGYILRGPETAAIDIKDPTKIIEYASLSSAAFEVSKDICKNVEIGEVNNMVVESEDTKIMCLAVNDQKVSIFMEKSVNHDKLCKELSS